MRLNTFPILNMVPSVSSCTFGPLASQMSPVASEQTEAAQLQTWSSVCARSEGSSKNPKSVQIKSAQSKCIQQQEILNVVLSFGAGADEYFYYNFLG